VRHDGKRLKRYTRLMSPKYNSPRQSDAGSGTKPDHARDGKSRVGYVLEWYAPAYEIKEVVNAFIDLLAITCNNMICEMNNMHDEAHAQTTPLLAVRGCSRWRDKLPEERSECALILLLTSYNST
jgi:hypothetical protein